MTGAGVVALLRQRDERVVGFVSRFGYLKCARCADACEDGLAGVRVLFFKDCDPDDDRWCDLCGKELLK